MGQCDVFGVCVSKTHTGSVGGGAPFSSSYLEGGAGDPKHTPVLSWGPVVFLIPNTGQLVYHLHKSMLRNGPAPCFTLSLAQRPLTMLLLTLGLGPPGGSVVEHPNFGFGSVGDLRVMGSTPASGSALSRKSACPSPSAPHAHSLCLYPSLSLKSKTKSKPIKPSPGDIARASSSSQRNARHGAGKTVRRECAERVTAGSSCRI